MIVLDASTSVLAVACASPEDERVVMAGEAGTETVELLVADQAVGQLRFRSREEPPPPALLRLVANLIALELERSKAPARASEAAVGDFLEDLLSRHVTDRENIAARAAELGCDLAPGATSSSSAHDRSAGRGRLARPGAHARRARRARCRTRLAGRARERAGGERRPTTAAAPSPSW